MVNQLKNIFDQFMSIVTLSDPKACQQGVVQDRWVESEVETCDQVQVLHQGEGTVQEWQTLAQVDSPWDTVSLVALCPFLWE